MLGLVLYRSPTYGYVVPAIVNGTQESLAEFFAEHDEAVAKAKAAGEEPPDHPHVPRLHSDKHVHLTPIALNEASPQRWNVPRDDKDYVPEGEDPPPYDSEVQRVGTWRPLD